jgi:hypothetical protein
LISLRRCILTSFGIFVPMKALNSSYLKMLA